MSLQMGTQPTAAVDLLSLAVTSREHHEQIYPHVERLPELADMLGRVDVDRFSAAFELEYRFITQQLVPHIDAVETALYGQLERLMEGRHSMTPMRHEHAELRRLIVTLGEYRARMESPDCLDQACAVGLRRALYRLYALLKVHLAEEELYLRVLDHNLSAQEKDLLARGIEHATAEPM